MGLHRLQMHVFLMPGEEFQEQRALQKILGIDGAQVETEKVRVSVVGVAIFTVGGCGLESV
jgi:hypothetical protein